MKLLTTLGLVLLAPALLLAAGRRDTGDFQYEGINIVRVEAETFDVRIQAIRGRHVRMEVHDRPEGYTVYHSVSGDQVTVWVERRFSLFTRPHGGTLVLLVPAQTDIGTRTSTGGVSVTRIEARSLEVATSTGSIDVADSMTDMRLSTSTGSVRVTNSSDTFEITTTTGPIVLERCVGTVSASSTTGRHRYQDVSGSVNARSSTGHIELDGVTGRIDLRTSTGTQSGRRVRLTEDSTFEASTGSIDMDLENDLAALEFDLRSSTGTLVAGAERSQRQLFLGSTGIRVSGRTSTGSQSFY